MLVLILVTFALALSSQCRTTHESNSKRMDRDGRAPSLLTKRQSRSIDNISPNTTPCPSLFGPLQSTASYLRGCQDQGYCPSVVAALAKAASEYYTCAIYEVYYGYGAGNIGSSGNSFGGRLPYGSNPGPGGPIVGGRNRFGPVDATDLYPSRGMSLKDDTHTIPDKKET